MERQPSRMYRWFVYPEPGNIFTNNLIAGELVQNPENICPEEPCEDGEKRDLFEINLQLLRKLRNARKEFSRLRFEIYSKRGGGKARKVNFLYDGRRLNSRRRKNCKKN